MESVLEIPDRQKPGWECVWWVDGWACLKCCLLASCSREFVKLSLKDWECLPQTGDTCLGFLRGEERVNVYLCIKWVCVLCLINTKTYFRVSISGHVVLFADLLGLNVFMCECVSVTQTVGFLELWPKKRKFDRVSWETSLGLALTAWPFPPPHRKTSKNTPNHPLSETYIQLDVLLNMLLVQVITVKNGQI